MPNAGYRWIFIILAAAGTAILSAPARADLQLCNRMSYVTDAAIAVEDKGAVATRGWFRVDPGQCRPVLQGTLSADQIYVYARVPALYGPSPLPQGGQADFCVGSGDFVIGGAKNCRSGQSVARFTAVKPSESDKGLTVFLAEDAEYTDDQARDAALQRLLVVAGYDANPIDGIRGAKTDAALMQFLQDNKLPATAAARADFFDIMLEIVQKPGFGFSWCNDTSYNVMAAIGVEDKSGVVTRGWYKVEPGKCLRPEITNRPLRLYSFGEAVDSEGQTIRGNSALSWGGNKVMCTRNVKFEIGDQNDCAAKGLSATGFATVELGRNATTVRFK